MIKYAFFIILIALALLANTFYQYEKSQKDYKLIFKDTPQEITETEKEVTHLPQINITANKEDIEKEIKDEEFNNKEQKNLTISEELIKKEILNREIEIEKKQRILENIVIELQSKLDSKTMLENKESVFAPGFKYSNYSYRKSSDEKYGFDFLVNLSSFDLPKDLKDEYSLIIQKYIDGEKSLEVNELQKLKIALGFFDCSESNGYSFLKQINEIYNIKILYVFENSKKEKDYVYYSDMECEKINKALEK